MPEDPARVDGSRRADTQAGVVNGLFGLVLLLVVASGLWTLGRSNAEIDFFQF